MSDHNQRRSDAAGNNEPVLPTTRFSSWVKGLLHEPLVHFLFIGALLFVIYDLRERISGDRAGARRIQLSVDDIRLLDASFEAQWSRSPTAQEHDALVEAKVREEILYREALAMGLDREDPIVKRRVAQKMEFLTDDATTVREPTTAEMRAFFETNTAQFAQPNRVTFRHLYFAPTRRGEHTRAEAEVALTKIAGESADSAVGAGLADTFMFQDYYADFSVAQLSEQFGTKFTEELLRTKPGSWQGPLQSSRGWHLVWVDAIAPAQPPNFAAAETQVRLAWLAAQKATAADKAYQLLRARYDIVIPSATEMSSVTNLSRTKP